MRTKETRNTRIISEALGVSCRFNEIDNLGFWVNSNTGEGYRITADSLKSGNLAEIGYVANNDHFTFVSSDPYAPISRLRTETANLDLPVRF